MLLMRRGLFKEAEPYFRTAIKRLTWKNPNPYNSEAYYLLGLDLCYLGREDEAYDAFYKAAWSNEQQCGIRQKASAFALHLRKTDPDVSLVTVGSREFYVYRYEGELNGIPNAAVILSYPKDGFGNPKALRVFLSTNAELSTQEILDTYTKRWPIELFFRQSKSKLALDSYQIRSRQGIQRYWLIMSLVHYLCCMHSGNYCTFEEGYASLKQQLKQEQFANLYRLIKSSASFEEAFKFVG